MRGLLSAAVLGILVSAIAPGLAAQELPSVLSPQEQNRDLAIATGRAAKFKRGINISHWLSQRADGDLGKISSFITETDFQTIRDLGLTHVRIPLDPAYFMDESNPERLRSEYMDYLDGALDQIFNRNLAAILVIHPDDAFKKRLLSDDRFVAAFGRFWRSFAARLNRRDSERLLLESINEPAFSVFAESELKGVDRWNWVQQEIARAIREGAPQHTIVGTDAGFSRIDGLPTLQPLPDKNVIYTLHFYTPMVFTSQGASWIPNFAYLLNIPYPSSPEVCAPILPLLDATLRQAVEGYCNDRWNAAALETRIATAANWSQRLNVPIFAGEFGTYELVAPPASRLNWLRDVRTLFEKYGIGWTMWDYAGGFALVDTTVVKLQRNGEVFASQRIRRIDPSVAEALGLP